MRLLGIINSEKCFDIVQVLFTDEKEYYRQAYINESLNFLVESLALCDTPEIMRQLIEDFLLHTSNNIRSLNYNEYGYIKDNSVKSFIYDVRTIDEDFCIQKNMDFSGKELILGFKFDDIIFIGNKDYVLEQLDLLIDTPKTQREYELMFKLYVDAYEFEKALKIAQKAIDEGIADLARWKMQKHYIEARITARNILNEIVHSKRRYGLLP